MTQTSGSYINANFDPFHFGEGELAGGSGRVYRANDDGDEAAEPATKFTLSAAYPNPFNSSSWITYELHETADIHIGLYNVNGQIVREFVNGVRQSGEYRIHFVADDLATGMYFVRAQSAGQYKVQKIMLLR